MVPGRRGYGNKGTKVVLRTNYFKLTTAYEANQPSMERTWFKYEVAVSPEPSRPKRRRLFDTILSHERFEGIVWASDYAKIIVTTKELDLGNGEWKQTITLPPVSGEQGNQPGHAPAFVQDAQARNRVTFRVERKGSFTPRHLVEYLRSNVPGAAYQSRVDLIQLFNIIMCKAPNTMNNVASVGQNKFYPYEPHPGTEKYDLSGGLQAMRGYY